MPTHSGETWLIVKTTRPAWGSTNVSVVVRRFFEPVVPIQPREDWKWSTRIPLDEREADAEVPPAPEPLEPEPPDAPAPEPLPDEPPVADPPELEPVAARAAVVAV